MKPYILIADNEEAIRDSLQYLLSEEGYIVHTASSEEELLRAVNLFGYDLIIAEIFMISSNPEAFFGVVSSYSPGPGMIITTPYEHVVDVLSLMRLGAFEYLIQPLGFKDLMESVNRLMRRT